MTTFGDGGYGGPARGFGPPVSAPHGPPGQYDPGFQSPQPVPVPVQRFGPSPPPSPPGSVGHRRGATWPGVLALVLVAVLLLGLGFQTWQVYRLEDQLSAVSDELSQQQAYERERIDALEGRASELERIAGESFNPEQIAEAVLPSVFRVSAGDFSGTAFAVGSEASGGGTNLFTNYHVVEAVWTQGGREVALERTDQRYDAEIVDVDPDADVALLRTSTPFDGLAVATEPARAGQQVVAVGAPFGLTDSVTVGVVSAADRDDIRGAPGRWMQFDAPINPGNSGGPVINAAQQVVGIATAGHVEAEGIGLARPIDVACELFEVC